MVDYISLFEAMVKNLLLRCSLQNPGLLILFHKFKSQINRYITKYATLFGRNLLFRTVSDLRGLRVKAFLSRMCRFLARETDFSHLLTHPQLSMMVLEGTVSIAYRNLI